MSNNNLEFLTFSVVFLYFFFGILLFTYQKGNRLSKSLLGFFFIAIGLIILDVFFQKTDFYKKRFEFAFILNTLPLVLGPLLLLLTKSVTHRNFTIQRKDLLHFIPYILAFSAFVFSYHIQDADYKRVFVEKVSQNDSLTIVFSSLFLFVLLSSYIFFSYQYLKKYRASIKEQISNLHKVNLEWLEHILIWFVFLISFTLLIQIAYHFYSSPQLVFNIALGLLLLGLFFFILKTIVKGIKSEDIFTIFEEDIILTKDVPTVEKTVDLTKLKSLKKHMEDNQPFLNPSINIKELASQLELNPRELSHLINHGMKQSFYDFINSYRIEFSKKKIAQSTDKKQTILEVMYESGFNSKSSFNTAFKKHAQLTPSEWKNKNS